MNKIKFYNAIKEFVRITFASILLASGVYFFMLPSNIAIGSVSALAMVLSNFIPLSTSVLNLILNVGLLLFGFLLIDAEFGIKSVYTTIIIPIILGVYEIIFPNFKSLTNDPIIDAVCAVFIIGISTAMLFTYNASSGGLDIIAKAINKYFHFDLGFSCSVIGIVVALCSAFCYDAKTVIIGVVSTYVYGKLIDHFVFGINIKRRVCILLDKSDEITQFILNDLKSGATLYKAVGAYTNKEKTEITTLVDKNEYRKLMDFIRKVDPKAFVSAYAINEVRYIPKNIK